MRLGINSQSINPQNLLPPLINSVTSSKRKYHRDLDVQYCDRLNNIGIVCFNPCSAAVTDACKAATVFELSLIAC
jgi:hypothetical protein